MPEPMTESEYLERLSGLYEKTRVDTPSGDALEIFERYRDAEFDLNIDYRLGVDFPDDRRAALRAIWKKALQDTEELKTRYAAHALSGESFAEAMQALTKNMADQYSALLSPDEMSAFLGGGPHSLPIMPEALG